MEKLSYREYLALIEEKAYQGDIPFRGSFELTPLCNLDCKMCYVHLQDPSVKDQMLSGEQWISMMQGAIDRGMMEALLTGGEAMTHPAFWDIYMYLINHGISTQVKTNGILLNEETVKRFQEFPPYSLDISLYGCNSESYVAVTGVDAYEKVVRHIRLAIEAGLRVQIMITPSSYMLPWTDRVMALAKSFGVSVMVNEVLVEAHENTGRKKVDFGMALEDDVRIKEKSKELLPPQYSSDDHEFFMRRRQRPVLSEKGLYCNAGRTGFAVNWDGIMVPCLNFPRDVVCAYPLRDGFERSWNEVNEGIKNYVVPQACHSCELNSWCHYCPMHHQKVAGKHLCDPDYCNYVKALFKAREKNTCHKS
jgi:radical SAM protein with 4Fe4S-binding SPASM domain